MTNRRIESFTRISMRELDIFIFSYFLVFLIPARITSMSIVASIISFGIRNLFKYGG